MNDLRTVSFEFCRKIIEFGETMGNKRYTSSLKIQAIRIRSLFFYSLLGKTRRERNDCFFRQMCIKPLLDRQMFSLPHVLSFRCLVTDFASFDD